MTEHACITPSSAANFVLRMDSLNRLFKKSDLGGEDCTYVSANDKGYGYDNNRNIATDDSMEMFLRLRHCHHSESSSSEPSRSKGNASLYLPLSSSSEQIKTRLRLFRRAPSFQTFLSICDATNSDNKNYKTISKNEERNDFDYDNKGMIANEVCYKSFERKIDSKEEKIRTERSLAALKGALMGACSPKKIGEILNLLDLNIPGGSSEVIKRIQSLCQSRILPGELRGIPVEYMMSSSGKTAHQDYGDATYIPHVFTTKQRQVVVNIFRTNGLVAWRKDGSAVSTMMTSLRDISRGEVERIILEEFTDTVKLSRALIHPATVIAPLRAVIRECMNSGDCVDISTHLPDGIIGDSVLTTELLVEHILCGLRVDKDKGNNEDDDVVADEEQISNDMKNLVLQANWGAVFCSENMVRAVTEDILPELICKHAQDRAREICDSRRDAMSSEKKMKSRRKETSNSHSISSVEAEVDNWIIPLPHTATEVAMAYPSLAELDERSTLSRTKATWNLDGSGDLVCDFCRQTLDIPSFRTKCRKALRIELSRIEGEIRKVDGPVEEVFESTFPEACIFLGLLSRAVRTISSGLDSEQRSMSNKLEKDLLCGPAAGFAARVTGYCLIKYGVQTEFHLSLGSGENKCKQGSWEDTFRQPTNLCQRFFESVYLSRQGINETESGVLDLLRELLPGNVGEDVALMWMFLGSECYEIGTENNSKKCATSGNLEEFICHVEESCLSMVGIPFRKPDRKAERKVMSLRRNLLAKALKVVGDKGKDVTELAVMLHFQKVKGLAVTGKELMDCLPSLISFERAIPKEVGEALCILAKQLSSGERVSSELIHKVRCDCLGGNT